MSNNDNYSLTFKHIDNDKIKGEENLKKDSQLDKREEEIQDSEPVDYRWFERDNIRHERHINRW